jgi:hypothetical protein
MVDNIITPTPIPPTALNITRSQIASFAFIAFQAFTVAGDTALGDYGRGAPYVHGSSTGPRAIQDVTGQWWQIDMSGVVSVKWFGAQGNSALGSTVASPIGNDDSSAIIAWNNALYTAGTGRGYVPSGVYRVTQDNVMFPYTVPVSVAIRGSSLATIIEGDGKNVSVFLMNNPNSAPQYFFRDPQGFTANIDRFVRNIGFLGGAPSADGSFDTVGQIPTYSYFYQGYAANGSAFTTAITGGSSPNLTYTTIGQARFTVGQLVWFGGVIPTSTPQIVAGTGTYATDKTNNALYYISSVNYSTNVITVSTSLANAYAGITITFQTNAAGLITNNYTVANQGITFIGVQASGFQTHFDLFGDQNNSEISFDNCSFSCSAIACIRNFNSQAVNIRSYKTDWQQFFGDLIQVNFGGGSIRFFGGSIIAFPDGTSTNRWLVQSPYGSLGDPVVFDGTRIELRGNYSNLINFAAYQGGRVSFLNCYILDEATTVKSSWLTIGNYARIDFDKCVLGQQNGYATLVKTTGGALVSEPGTVWFDKCQLPTNFSDQCSFTGYCGRIVVTNSYTQGGPNGNNIEAVNFNLRQPTAYIGSVGSWTVGGGSAEAGLADIGPLEFQVYLKPPAGSWPVAGNNLDQWTLLLPKGAIITRIVVTRPPLTGGNGTTFQWAIADSVPNTLATTVAAASNVGAHFDTNITNPGTLAGVVSPWGVGDVTNNRTLTLRSTAAVTGTGTGGEVIVYYR